MALFTGSGVAMVTPFNDGGINYKALEKLLDHVIEGGTSAIFVCGTTGEPSTMTMLERIQLVEYTIKYVDRRVPIFAGSGGNNTKEVIIASQQFEALGVDGLLVVTPYYNKCTQNGCVAHYQAISDNVNAPIIAYNVPSRTGFNIAPSTAQKLADIKNVRAIKEASGNIDQMLEVARLINGKIDFYSGDDSLTVPAMSLGASGVISVAANVIPSEITNLTHLCLNNNYHEAKELQFKLAPFIKSLFCEVNPIPCKKALQLIGIDAGSPRMPLTEMEAEHVLVLKNEMIKLGIFQ